MAFCVAVLGVTGCAGPGDGSPDWHRLGLIQLLKHEPPVSIAIEATNEGIFDTADWAFIKRREPWAPLAKALAASLGRPVRFRPLKPFQIAHHLGRASCDFALVSQEGYAVIRDENSQHQVIAIPETRQRRGLIVVNARSGIRDFADLKGKRFAFGPRTDPVLFFGALEVLDRHGVSPADVQQEFTLGGFDGAWQHHPSSRNAAREIVYRLGTDAGVIEESDYDQMPPTGGRWLPLFFTFSKDQLVVLGRTELIEADTIRDGVFVASESVSRDLLEGVRGCLVSAHVRYVEALHALGYQRFRVPTTRTAKSDGDPNARDR